MKESNHEITLAVFPFENLADGSTARFYCKSLYLDLVTELSRFRQFRIVAHESTDVFAERSPDYAIKGSFRSIDGDFRISAQLLKPAFHEIIWADHFEGNKNQLVSIQDDLLEKIAASLQQQLNYDLLSQMRRKDDLDASAYEFWLCGMEELRKGTLEADENARAFFQKAIEIDPGYPLAYSGMSLTFFNEWSCRLWERWEVSRLGAYEWARKAIDLDNQNYIAAVVLGRVHLHEGNYDLSEHYLRRALRLNPNDTDCLIQIASCFVFLGYVDEAHSLHQRVLQLNPINFDNYKHIAAFIALERGEFDESIETGRHVAAPWLDFDAFLAAAAYHAGNRADMGVYWKRFLQRFEECVIKKPALGSEEAVHWLRIVNPYKSNSYFEKFLDFIRNAQSEEDSDHNMPGDRVVLPRYAFIKRGDIWEMAFDGKSIIAIELKGFFDIAKMLASPEKQFHCTELMGTGLFSEGEPVFDDKAKKAYRRRLQELKEEIDETDLLHNHERRTQLQMEYDSLMRHLTTSLGIGGKSRKTNDPVEKVRSAVTWRVRKAIQRIEKEHPVFGKHLSLSIKTGVFCAYRPESVSEWTVVL